MVLNGLVFYYEWRLALFLLLNFPLAMMITSVLQLVIIHMLVCTCDTFIPQIKENCSVANKCSTDYCSYGMQLNLNALSIVTHPCVVVPSVLIIH